MQWFVIRCGLQRDQTDGAGKSEGEGRSQRLDSCPRSVLKTPCDIKPAWGCSWVNHSDCFLSEFVHEFLDHCIDLFNIEIYSFKVIVTWSLKVWGYRWLLRCYVALRLLGRIWFLLWCSDWLLSGCLRVQGKRSRPKFLWYFLDFYFSRILTFQLFTINY